MYIYTSASCDKVLNLIFRNSSDDEHSTKIKRHESKHKKHKNIKEEPLSSDEKNSYVINSKEEEQELKHKLLDKQSRCKKRSSNEREWKCRDVSDDRETKKLKEPSYNQKKDRDRSRSPSRKNKQDRTDRDKLSRTDKRNKHKEERDYNDRTRSNKDLSDNGNHRKDDKSSKWDQGDNKNSRNWDSRGDRSDRPSNSPSNNRDTDNRRNRDRPQGNNTREWDHGKDGQENIVEKYANLSLLLRFKFLSSIPYSSLRNFRLQVAYYFP